MQIPDLTNLAVLLSPVVAAPLVRWLANTLAKTLGGLTPAWWGIILAALIEMGLTLVLAPAITPEVVARGVIYTLFTFAGAFGLNEWLSARNYVPEETRMVSGGPPTQVVPAPGSWLKY